MAVITTGSAPAALGGNRTMKLADGQPKGRKHLVKLQHDTGPGAPRKGTMAVIAPTREEAENIAARSWPESTVLRQFANKPVME